MVDDRDRLEAAAGWWRLFHRRSPGGTVELPLLSGSMAPALPVGSTLEIAVETEARPGVGDVVVFREDDRLVAHRLLLGLPPGRPRVFLQAGDGTSRAGWLPVGEIAGRVLAVRDEGGARRDLTTPPARREARRLARRRLVRLAVAPVSRLFRRLAAWLPPR